MTTVSAVRLAISEFGALPGGQYGHSLTAAAQLLASDPTACTMIANAINDKGTAGEMARDRNLAALRDMLNRTISKNEHGALEWAIDQLSRAPVVAAEPQMMG